MRLKIVALVFWIGIMGWTLKDTLIAQAIDVTPKKQHLWLEIWNDDGYQKTNAWYETQRNFWLSPLAVKGGFRFYLRKYSFLFVDLYLKADILWDLGNKEHNRFFWNNNLKYGPGIRIRVEHRRYFEFYEQYSLKVNYSNLDLFVEYLGISFINRGMDVPENIPRNNLRTGLNSWISIDNNYRLSTKGIFCGVWFEMWSDLSYHSTNFFMKGKDKFNILTLCPKVGLRVAYRGVALEPYFRFDLVRDLLDQDWNKEAWSNNRKYGPGIRLSLGELTKRTDTSIYVYTEYVKIDYHSRVGWKSAGLSNFDIRAGINLWIPFGASKGSRGMIH